MDCVTPWSKGSNAGMDLLLIAFDGRQYYRAMRCALDAREQGRLDSAMLARATSV